MSESRPPEPSIWTWSLREFLDRTVSEDPTPGGGSVAAAAGAFGLGLVMMALEISARKAHPEQQQLISARLERARPLLNRIRESADEDIVAFRAYMAALGLPKSTDEEKSARREALRAALLVATEAPLAAGRALLEALEIARDAADLSSSHLVSDAGAGAALLGGALSAVLLNVDVNAASIRDEALRQQVVVERQNLKQAGDALAAEALSRTAGRIGEK
jgi:formiminotetrahydrofolate cyclodeaminase